MFYIEQNEKIVLFDTDKTKLENTLKFMPQYEDLEIKETERPIENFAFADTPEYLAKKAAEETERIAALNLTAADVERAIYKAKGIDFDDVIALVETQSVSEDGTPTIDVKALKIELKANNFYRGNPYIDAVGQILGFTSKQMDEFFETNDYTKLLTTTEENTESEDL